MTGCSKPHSACTARWCICKAAKYPGNQRERDIAKVTELLEQAAFELNYAQALLPADAERLMRVTLNGVAINFAKEQNIATFRHGAFNNDSPGGGLGI